MGKPGFAAYPPPVGWRRQARSRPRRSSSESTRQAGPQRTGTATGGGREVETDFVVAVAANSAMPVAIAAGARSCRSISSAGCACQESDVDVAKVRHIDLPSCQNGLVSGLPVARRRGRGDFSAYTLRDARCDGQRPARQSISMAATGCARWREFLGRCRGSALRWNFALRRSATP